MPDALIVCREPGIDLKPLLAPLAAARVRVSVEVDRRASWPLVVVLGPLEWVGVPEGKEVDAFAAAISVAAGAPVPGARADLPEVTAVVSASCSRCPETVRRLVRRAGRGELRLTVVEASIWNAARAPRVSATPTVIVGEARLVGALVSDETLEGALRSRGREALAAALRSQLDAGELDAALATVRASPACARLAGEWVGGEEFSLRLAAMTLVERLAREPGGVPPEAAAAVRALLDDPRPPVRGDACYLLGQIRDRAARVGLERLAADADGDAEVAEAAREALAALGAGG